MPVQLFVVWVFAVIAPYWEERGVRENEIF
jgi:hypothetical protein